MNIQKLDYGNVSADDASGLSRAVVFGPQYRTFLRELRLKSFSEEILNKKQAGESGSRLLKSDFWQAVVGKSLAKKAKDQTQKKPCATDVRVDLSGWINLPYGIHTTVSLVVEYYDGSEYLAFKVDESDSKGAIQVLLSGSVDIIADCEVESLKLYCYGIDDKSVWIENFEFKQVNGQE